jgi:hypothetical protein
VEEPLGEDVPPLRVGRELDLVDHEEVDLAVDRHRLDQGHLRLPDVHRDPVVDLAGEEAQRQPDHAPTCARASARPPVGLAGVGRPQEAVMEVASGMRVEGQRSLARRGR